MSNQPAASGHDKPEPVTDFAGRLRDHRRRAGEPSLRVLERLTRQAGRPYPRATIDDKLQGRTVPDWEFVEAFVGACHRNARWPGEPDLDGWREDHLRLLGELARRRVGQRRAATAAADLEDRSRTGRGQPTGEPDRLVVTVKLADVDYIVVRGPAGAQEIPASGHRVRLIVEAVSPPAVLLTGLRPVVVARRSHLGELNPHHGAVQVRQFDVFLDEDPPRLAPCGHDDFPFKVTPDDPEVFDLIAHTDLGDVQWVLDLDWTSAGRSGVRRVDLGGHPFRTMARPGSGR